MCFARLLHLGCRSISSSAASKGFSYRSPIGSLVISGTSLETHGKLAGRRTRDICSLPPLKRSSMSTGVAKQTTAAFSTRSRCLAVGGWTNAAEAAWPDEHDVPVRLAAVIELLD